MADPTDLALGGGGVITLGGAAYALIKMLGGRQISNLDETLKSLAIAVDELRKTAQNLRETDIAQAKDIGALQEGQKMLTARIDGMGDHWRKQMDGMRRRR